MTYDRFMASLAIATQTADGAASAWKPLETPAGGKGARDPWSRVRDTATQRLVAFGVKTAWAFG